MAVLFPWELARLPSGWTPQGVCSSVRARSAVQRAPAGEVAERLNAPVLKTGSSSRGSWVRIPPSPPEIISPVPQFALIQANYKSAAARIADARGFPSSGVPC